MKVGNLVRHKDKLGPQGLGKVTNVDTYSVRVCWLKSERSAVYHRNILMVVKEGPKR